MYWLSKIEIFVMVKKIRDMYIVGRNEFLQNKI